MQEAPACPAAKSKKSRSLFCPCAPGMPGLPGLSIPGLIKNDLELGTDNDEVTSQSIRHLYMMGGAAFPVNESLVFKPQFLLRSDEAEARIS